MNKKDIIRKLLSTSFDSLSDLVEYENRKNNVPHIKSVIELLQSNLLRIIFDKNNPFASIPLKLKIDILKRLKIDFSNEVFLNDKLIFKSLILKDRADLPNDVFFLKSDVFQDKLPKELSFLDTFMDNPKQMLLISQLENLIGLKVSFDFKFDNECLSYLNKIKTLRFLSMVGDIQTDRSIFMPNLETACFKDSILMFYRKNKIKRLCINKIVLSNMYIDHIARLELLEDLEFVDCILPSNIMNIFEAKIKRLKIVDCKSSFSFKPEPNFFIEQLFIKNFDFLIGGKDSPSLKERFRNVLQKCLKNTTPINFYFQIDF